MVYTLKANNKDKTECVHPEEKPHIQARRLHLVAWEHSQAFKDFHQGWSPTDLCRTAVPEGKTGFLGSDRWHCLGKGIKFSVAAAVPAGERVMVQGCHRARKASICSSCAPKEGGAPFP